MMKKVSFIAAVLAAMTVLSVCLCGFSQAEGFINEIPFGDYKMVYGDVSLDGKVTTGDASMTLKYCSDIVNFNAMQLINGDVNCDGEINTADAGVILRHIAGLVLALPYMPDSDGNAGSISFKNNTFPKEGTRLPYGRSYALNGVLMSRYALKSVTIRITDENTNTVEINETVDFGERDSVYYYNTQTSDNAIDNLIRFSVLTTGKKKLDLFCKSAICSNALVYSARFNIGYTFNEIAPYCYNRSGEVSATEARAVLSILNSIDFVKDDGARIVEKGTRYLGKRYSEMDCSRFVQQSVKDALGIPFPRTSVDQAVYCIDNDMIISMDEKKPGDLIFMTNTECSCGRYHEIHHSAIYVGQYDGVDYIIESASGIGGVVMRRLWGLSGGTWTIDCWARVR